MTRIVGLRVKEHNRKRTLEDLKDLAIAELRRVGRPMTTVELSIQLGTTPTKLGSLRERYYNTFKSREVCKSSTRNHYVTEIRLADGLEVA